VFLNWDKSLAEVTVDEVIMGNVLQAGQGQNPGRQAMIYAGVPKETPAFTVNKICGSGMKAVGLAAQSIRAGDAEVVIAGGIENMSQTPYYFPKARWGARMFNTELVDGMVYDGLWEIFYNYHMGMTSETLPRNTAFPPRAGTNSLWRAIAAHWLPSKRYFQAGNRTGRN